MSDGSVVVLRDLSQPENTERSGHLVSSGRGWAELELTDGGAPISPGTPVGLQTSHTIYLGHVQHKEIQAPCSRLRVRVDHSLAVQDVCSIQNRWNQEQPA
jgi:hypothetical protein